MFQPENVFTGCRYLTLVITLGAISVAGHRGAGAVGPSDTAPTEPFPKLLSPELPYDVDVEALAKLDRDKQVPEAQRLFDVFAWRALIALNWPAKPDGSPDIAKNMSDNSSKRVWESWRRNDTIFLPDGAKPAP